MSRELKFTVENAGISTQEIDTTYEGVPAKITVERAVIECLPDDAAGKTFTMVLPADALGEYPEGSKVTVTVTAEQEG